MLVICFHSELETTQIYNSMMKKILMKKIILKKNEVHWVWTSMLFLH